MRVVVTTEKHFGRSPDGTIYCDQGARAYEFWQRYLDVFEEVVVLARVSDRDEEPAHPTEGQSVSVHALPGYVGPSEYVRRLPAIVRRMRGLEARDAAFILRAPGAVSDVASRVLWPARHPYAMEVVGDPYDVLAPGACSHPLAFMFRSWAAWNLRRQCAGACAAAYVNQGVLPKRYATRPGALVTHYSSIELSAEHMASSPRAPSAPPAAPKAVFVGTLASPIKAPDVLVDAAGICVRSGMNLHVVFVGDGALRGELEQQAAQQGLNGHVEFLGQLPAGDAVRRQLDGADVFILPSHSEGLPRAIIEAMARGLPCIGTAVGGIPELLPPEALVPPADPAALAAKIRQVCCDPARMTAMSARNLNKAAEYLDEALRKRRQHLYRHLRERTQEWLSSAGR